MIVNPSVSGGGSKIQYYNIKAQDVQFNKSGRTCTVTITLPSLIKTLLGLGVCIWDGSTSSFSISYPGCDLTGSDDLTAAFLHTSTTDGAHLLFQPFLIAEITLHLSAVTCGIMIRNFSLAPACMSQVNSSPFSRKLCLKITQAGCDRLAETR